MAFITSAAWQRKSTRSRFVSHRMRTSRLAPRCVSMLSRSQRKGELLDFLQPLSCGAAVLADSAVQNEIDEKVRALEESTPSVQPVRDVLLPGVYRLDYTTSSSILAINRPLFFRPLSSGIYQIISDDASSVTNVEIIAPFSVFGWKRPTYWNRVRAAASAGSSDKRVEVQFTKFELFNGLLSFDVSKNRRFSNWLDVTYLDETMRISRGGEGNLFVLTRVEDPTIKSLAAPN